MAFPTVEQADTMLQLGAEHGPPEFAMIERTEAAYGVIWCHWPGSPHLGVLGEQPRNRLIKPDGAILLWDSLPPKGA